MDRRKVRISQEGQIMKRKSLDLFIVIAITLVAVVVAFVLPADNVPGRMVTLPLVLVLPGYALAALLFTRQGMGIAERLMLSLGVSLVLTVLSGLLLNLIPYGLQTRSWALILGAVTLGASLGALARRRSSEPASDERRLIGITLPAGILLGLAALIVAGAITLSRSGATQQQNNAGTTQLWMLPATNSSQLYNVRLGVSNMQPTNAEYDLTVSVDGTTIQHWSALQLKPHEQWLSNLALPEHAGPEHVVAVLNRSDAPSEQYRHVDLWLGVRI